MTEADLTTAQAKKIYDALYPALGFLMKLERRLTELEFPNSDEYFLKVAAAHDAMHRLTVETHYRSCTARVGRPYHVEQGE